MNQREEEIYSLLSKNYPDARIALNYKNPWELLVCVVLSAQCTDKRVNIVTEKLFRKYASIEDYARADLKEFEGDIRSTGFYRNKAKNIISSAKFIINNFNGKVPDNMDDLLKLQGVARKTANIVALNAYGIICGIAVDTHVKRLSAKLGFTKENNPVKIENDLMKIFPRKLWGKLSYLLIEHGRALCKAVNPACGDCFLKDLCPGKMVSRQNRDGALK